MSGCRDPMHLDRRGLVLWTVLWITVLIVSMAVGTARRLRTDAALVRYAVGAQRARALLWSGRACALVLLRQDVADPDSRSREALRVCGVPSPPGGGPSKTLRGVVLPDGRVRMEGAGGVSDEERWIGFQDETRRLDLNALREEDVGIFVELLVLRGVPRTSARGIAAALLDWIDADDVPRPDGAETYADHPCRNGPLESIEELRLIRGVTSGIFARLKGDVTVFPRRGILRINLDTATPAVFAALARFSADPALRLTRDDADGLTRKALAYRRGPDGVPGTADDRRLVEDEMDLNRRERILWRRCRRWHILGTDLFRVRIRAVEGMFGVSSSVDMVLDRRDGAVLSWRRLSEEEM